MTIKQHFEHWIGFKAIQLETVNINLVAEPPTRAEMDAVNARNLEALDGLNTRHFRLVERTFFFLRGIPLQIIFFTLPVGSWLAGMFVVYELISGHGAFDLYPGLLRPIVLSLATTTLVGFGLITALAMQSWSTVMDLLDTLSCARLKASYVQLCNKEASAAELSDAVLACAASSECDSYRLRVVAQGRMLTRNECYEFNNAVVAQRQALAVKQVTSSSQMAFVNVANHNQGRTVRDAHV